MIVVNGKKFTSLEQDIFIGGKKVIEAYAGNRLVYPTEDVFKYDWTYILTWTDSSLNLHLHVYDAGEYGDHVYWANPVSENVQYIKLGPQKQAITFQPYGDEQGAGHVIVYDYTHKDDANSNALAYSGVKVQVYYKKEFKGECEPTKFGNYNTWSAYHGITPRDDYGYNRICRDGSRPEL